MGRLLVRARPGMPAITKATASPVTSHSPEDHLVKPDVGRADPYAVQTEARRAHASLVGQGEGGAWRPGRASQPATKDRHGRLVSRRACGLAPCARQSTGPGPGLRRAPKGPDATDFSPKGLQMGSKAPLASPGPFFWSPDFSVEAIGTLNALNTQLEETRTFGDQPEGPCAA